MLVKILFLVITVVYCLLILSLAIAWKKIKYFFPEEENDYQQFSIVIVFRNEESALDKCLHALENLDYPKESFEVLLVNDHSQDGSVEKVETFIRSHPLLQIKLLHNEQQGKKSAVKTAIAHASFPLIATTDADCEVPNQWLKIYNAYYHRYGKKMMLAPVAFADEKKYFSQLQQLELGALMISTGGAVQMGKPIMCNAANMCYEKEVYDTLQSNMQSCSQIASGDDVFLLHACSQHYGSQAIGYVKTKEIIVRTAAQKTLRDFIAQRVRWASKTGSYSDKFTKMVAMVVGLESFLILISSILAIFGGITWWLWCVLVVMKFMVDACVIMEWLAFINKKSLWWKCYFMAAIAYPVYVVWVLLKIPFSKKIWKDRNYMYKGKKKNDNFADIK